MAFLAETKVLTTKGWKNIEDVAGHDRVLVRNFIGDAQFVQPFAIRKKSYSGPVILAGSTRYKFKVTPEHTVVYKNRNDELIKSTAADVPPKREHWLKHRSRYAPDEYLRSQKIRNGQFEYQVSNLDWYMLVGFVLRRGQINKGRTRLILMLDKQNPQKDMELICPVLDRLGLQYNLTPPNLLVLSQRSNIARKLARSLGSRYRKQMFIPDNMIYNSSIEDGSALIEMFIRTSRQDGKGVENTVQFSTTNTKLVDSLEILGLLCGYTISKLLVRPAGTKVPAGVTKRDSYVVYVRKSVTEVSIITKEELTYNGKVYEVDMFDDQLLIKEEGSLPLWMKPK